MICPTAALAMTQPNEGGEDTVDQKTNSQDEEPVTGITSKAVKIGAAIGMTAGWLIGLIYVLAAFPPVSFQLRSTADGILLAAPVLGAALGAGIGWLLRDSERFARLALPSWTTRKEFKWGWKAGTVAGLGLGQNYIATHSPLGFYTGSITLVFESFVPLCAALGAGVGWLFIDKVDDIAPPAPSQ
jgi:hypothetical protein